MFPSESNMVMRKRRSGLAVARAGILVTAGSGGVEARGRCKDRFGSRRL